MLVVEINHSKALVWNNLINNAFFEFVWMHPFSLQLWYIMTSSTAVCADCDANNPQWASINRGVYICDECNSIHRQLGRLVSHVILVYLQYLIYLDQTSVQVIMATLTAFYGAIFNQSWRESVLGTYITWTVIEQEWPINSRKSI